ncbi:MAG: helix-turn-helix domain-containing protein, partial [Candidatus Woesearchaeota archaeon]
MENIPLLALQEAGLGFNESKVYYALLLLGNATATQITKKSQVHRINVYDLLKSLQDKGLISVVFNDKKKVYVPANPKRLLELVKEKEYLITQSLPHLNQLFEEKKQPN